MFSLGCVFHYVLVPGEHPFGQWYEREANIMANRLVGDLKHLDAVPDAADLIRRMLMRDQRFRPTSAEVCHHPFFWSASRRLDFFTDLSDLIEHQAPTRALCVNVLPTLQAQRLGPAAALRPFGGVGTLSQV